MNSFKEIQKEQEDHYKDNIMGIKSKINSNLGLIGIITNLIDVYFSKLMGCFVASTGGKVSIKDDQNPKEN
jgi:hypothetical protein